MKLAYFDCFSGISGDMTLGALVDAGCDVEQLRTELRGLQVLGWELTAEKVWKNGMPPPTSRSRREPAKASLARRDSGDSSEIAARSQVRERAAAIFTKLGEAEARVHDVRSKKFIFTNWAPLTLSWTSSALASAFTPSASKVRLLRFERRRRHCKNGARNFARSGPRYRDFAARKADLFHGVQKELVTPTGARDRRDALRFVRPQRRLVSPPSAMSGHG